MKTVQSFAVIFTKKAQVNEKIKTSHKILHFTQQHDYSDEL